MATRLRMKRNVARPSLGKIRNDPVDRFHHQMDVNWRLDAKIS